MVRVILGVIILIATIITSILLYLWVAGETFDRWFDEWLVIAGVTFFLAAGIVISALLFERGIKALREQDNDRR